VAGAATGRVVLVGILATLVAQPAVTEVMRHNLDAAASPERLAMVREHIA
jgi:hypothetical protein